MKKLKVKPGQLPEWAKYVAKDAVFKTVYIYEKKPYINQNNNRWSAVNASKIEISDLKIKGPWEKSLRKIKVVDDYLLQCPYCDYIFKREVK